MTFSENLTEYRGMPVADWSPGTAITDGTAYRIGLTWDEDEKGQTWTDKFAGFLNAIGTSEVTALVVGGWDGMIEQEGDTAPVVEALVAARDRLPNLTGLFFGDVTYEECEVSWL
jgi:hypothetical protein